jgi:maltose/moltooligosaccharide transporter
MAAIPLNPEKKPFKKGPDSDGLYRVGTLTYTKAGLAMLCVWLLWGDFCYTVMEGVTPSLIPVKLNELHASNFEIGVLLGSIPSTVYTCLNPIISFKSDRFRSKWGRRIPFLLFSLPFILLGLIALAYFEPIATFLHTHLGASVAQMPANKVAIYTLTTINIVFTFFNTFLASVFWYLFNDVVPEHLLARFMSWFRLVSLAGQTLYSFFVVKYASSHFTEIYLCAAALYFVGFMLICLNVKEGEYPPPPEYVGGKTGPVAAVKTYLQDCHVFPHYWYQWIGNFLGSIGGSAGNIGAGAYTAFSLRFYHNLGIDVGTGDIGFIFGSIGLATAVLILVSGWLADIFHPIRVVMAGVLVGFFLVLPANMIFLFWQPKSHAVAFWLVWGINVFLAAPALALNGVSDPPLLMRLFPRSRYGQFCSVNAFWRMGGGIVGGGMAGAFLDYMVTLVGEHNAYFYIPVWQFLFAIPCLFLFIGLYQSWKRHGGDDNYAAPVLEASHALGGHMPIVSGNPAELDIPESERGPRQN